DTLRVEVIGNIIGLRYRITAILRDFTRGGLNEVDNDPWITARREPIIKGSVFNIGRHVDHRLDVELDGERPVDSTSIGTLADKRADSCRFGNIEDCFAICVIEPQ